MPAVEAEAGERELTSYELAFHVLPTIADGEVTNIFQGLKDLITKHGGEILSEEAPARFDLAYDIEKYLEGRNRKFSSAYFGWIRFSVKPAEVEHIGVAVKGDNQILRHLLIKLTKSEEAHPFFFHEAISSSDKVKNIDLDEKDPAEDEVLEDDIEAVVEEEDKV